MNKNEYRKRIVLLLSIIATASVINMEGTEETKNELFEQITKLAGFEDET